MTNGDHLPRFIEMAADRVVDVLFQRSDVVGFREDRSTGDPSPRYAGSG